MRSLAILFGVLAVWLSAQPAVACTCPKEQMIKEYGSVSMLGGVAKPRPGPLRPVAAAPAASAPNLPLLWPVAEKRRFGAGLGAFGLDPFALSLPEL